MSENFFPAIGNPLCPSVLFVWFPVRNGWRIHAKSETELKFWTTDPDWPVGCGCDRCWLGRNRSGIRVDPAPAGARFGWVYNGCNGTGDYHPRSRFWARYTADGTVTISRGFDGQAFPAWVQGIDLSGLNP